MWAKVALGVVLGFISASGWSEVASSVDASSLDKAADANPQLLDLTQSRSSSSGNKTLLSGQPASKNQFLSARQAFGFSALQTGNSLNIRARITPNHYLYQQRFSVQAGQGLTVGKISFDQSPEFENDPEFGRVPVFHRDVSLSIPVQGSGRLTLNWQGCAKAGVCYPPEQFQTQVVATSSTNKTTAPNSVTNPTTQQTDKTDNQELLKNTDQSDTEATKNQQNAAAKPSKNQPDSTKQNIAKVKITALGETPPIVATALPEPISNTSTAATSTADTSLIANAQPSTTFPVNQANSMVSDPFGLADHTLVALGLLFLAGLGLAFTPCVLPMLPIVANLVATQHRRSAGHGFLLAAGYALGVACSYALLGALVALFGHQLNLIAWSQQPAILIGFAVIFVVLALHSFDLFELRLPQFIRGRVERVGQYGQSAKWSGSVIGCWVAGFFSALIVSPCLSAPLAGVLLSVSTVGNPWLGALALFCLGLGLGVPLMILGATEGRFLPKAGNWLNWVRRGFGLLLFGVALILLNRVFQTSWMLLLWAVLSGFFALWLWYWAGRGRLLSKVLSVLVGIFAVLQVVGAALGATDPIRPLSPLLVQKQTAQSVDTIYTLAQLRQYQQQHPRLLVELTADWCISCKIVERELFLQNPAPELQQWTRVKLDVSQTTPESHAVLKALNVFGPPALMLYQDGQQVEQLLGEPEPQAFRTVLQQHAP